MSKKPAGPRIATANRLDDGHVVFLAPDGEWTQDFRRARIAREDGEAAALESVAYESAKANIVVDPYLIELSEQDGSGMAPVEHRERMRTIGPTVGHSLDVRPREKAA